MSYMSKLIGEGNPAALKQFNNKFYQVLRPLAAQVPFTIYVQVQLQVHYSVRHSIDNTRLLIQQTVDI